MGCGGRLNDKVIFHNRRISNLEGGKIKPLFYIMYAIEHIRKTTVRELNLRQHEFSDFFVVRGAHGLLSHILLIFNRSLYCLKPTQF